MKAPEVPFRLQIAFPEILFYFVAAVAMVQKRREKRVTLINVRALISVLRRDVVEKRQGN